ncbi:GNAT family N-acetyltransferase [Chitinivorax sp. PXF-14]|uniref:GNAT family N-acetyltransferase n=1 Tax=Chitinivorax sp. PXF-14 TaxID=3230488 RepID=UPI0034671DEA
MQLIWQCKPFSALSTDELYDLMVLRQRVFVLEQACLYLDADGKDKHAYHLMGRDEDGALQGYARLLPAGASYPDPSFGRVVTAPEARGLGLGHALAGEIMACMARLFPAQAITIGAQAHLQGFYGGYGFVAVGAVYLEDGIPHLDMRWQRAP